MDSEKAAFLAGSERPEDDEYDPWPTRPVLREAIARQIAEDDPAGGGARGPGLAVRAGPAGVVRVRPR